LCFSPNLSWGSNQEFGGGGAGGRDGGKKKSAYRVVGKCEGKRELGTPRFLWKNSFKNNLKEIG
jgi:hypothetical protein